MHERLDLCVLIPRLAIHLISANIEIRIWKQLRHLRNELVQEFVCPLLGGIHYSVNPTGLDPVSARCAR